MMKRFLLFLQVVVIFSTTAFSQFNEEKLKILQDELNSIVLPVDNSGVSISVKVVHADFNKELYSFKPEIKMIPASITKLITSACAFYKLGSGYQFKTVVYTDDNNINDGEINGNIYIKGFGDPDLNSSDIANLTNQIVSRSIRRITGNVVSDESFFDTDYNTISGNFSGDTGPTWWPYINALAFNKNDGNMNPGLSCASTLSSFLTGSSIEVQGTTISGVTPSSAKELAQISHSIFDILSYMNKESDNHSAITMFKVLGAKLISEPGTIEKGQQAVADFLTQIGVSRYTFEILEGSGLSRYNKVNAELYIKLLKFLYDDKFLFDYFMNSLSVAGKDGTLRRRMIGTEAEGNVYAKTGTLNGVSSLAGYVINRDEEILIFYVVLNGSGNNSSRMRAVQDDIAITLAQFTRK